MLPEPFQAMFELLGFVMMVRFMIGNIFYGEPWIPWHKGRRR